MGLPGRASLPDRRIWTGPAAGMGHAFVLPGDPDRLLVTGDPVRIQMVEQHPLPGLLDHRRRQVTGLQVIVRGERALSTYRANVALYVPPEAKNLLKKDTVLPGKVAPGKRYVVAIDWERAFIAAQQHEESEQQ